jgi:hypothetical protein
LAGKRQDLIVIHVNARPTCEVFLKGGLVRFLFLAEPQLWRFFTTSAFFVESFRDSRHSREGGNPISLIMDARLRTSGMTDKGRKICKYILIWLIAAGIYATVLTNFTKPCSAW